MANPNSRIVALDVGEKRIGVASANVVAKLASPLVTIPVSDTVFDDIKDILSQETAVAVVVGLPRGLNGQNTKQTLKTKKFIEELGQKLSIPLYWQDEALTSVLSENKLKTSKSGYRKEQIDSLAATYILEDFLQEDQEFERA